MSYAKKIFALDIAAASSARGAIADLFERRFPSIALRFKTPTGAEPVEAPCVIGVDFMPDFHPDGEFVQWTVALDVEMHNACQ